MDYRIIRSFRKTMSLVITKDGTPEVRCPYFVSAADIRAFVAAHAKWMESRSADISAAASDSGTFTVGTGSRLLYLGREYPVLESNQAHFDGSAFCFTAGSDMRRQAVTLYKVLAREYLESRTQYYSEIMGVRPSGIKITSALTRWGSCTPKNGINFSWLLIMALPDAIDSVIVHELAHIRQHNHSAAFYAEVYRFCPDYDSQHASLKNLSLRLRHENWKL